MPEILVLARFIQNTPVLSSPSDWPDGLIGRTVWQGVEDESSKLVAIHFRDAEVAESRLKTIVEETMRECTHRIVLPDSVLHVVIEDAQGLTIDKMEMGEFAYFGHFITKLGYGPQTRQLADETLRSFILIDEFAGFILGENQVIDEELWFVCLWRKMPPDSILMGAAVNTNLYRRVA